MMRFARKIVLTYLAICISTANAYEGKTFWQCSGESQVKLAGVTKKDKSELILRIYEDFIDIEGLAENETHTLFCPWTYGHFYCHVDLLSRPEGVEIKYDGTFLFELLTKNAIFDAKFTIDGEFDGEVRTYVTCF